MSYFDEEIEKDFVNFGINYEKLDDATHDKLVTKINKNLLFTGSKIAWNSLPDRTSSQKHNADTAFIEISKKVNNLEVNEIIFIGDSLTESAYKVHTMDLEKTLAMFVYVPQHTYFFSNRFNFIGCISSEGEINFSEIHF
ncbi:hypothetical protein [Pseudomonas sp. PB106]|uniref:hypothetical protein n=1 Tax=Pseudomonas sp. PB106 TaxID=2494699 RepID=UPI00131D972D|nr:hypothetical protein [Pseudomonas sp. PB106]KAE9648178.1 hypothetical protein EJA71_05680 [Pseudomonas sp. PB106]